jgi:hypothetical protein
MVDRAYCVEPTVPKRSRLGWILTSRLPVHSGALPFGYVRIVAEINRLAFDSLGNDPLHELVPCIAVNEQKKGILGASHYL